MRFTFKPAWQHWQVWRDERDGLSSEPAQWALVAAMTKWVVLDGPLVVVDLDAELGGVAEERLQLGGDRRIIGASKSGRSGSRRRCGGKKLNDERKSNGKRRQL